MTMEHIELESIRRGRAYFDMIEGASGELDISTPELAKVLKVRPQRIYEWKENGSIPFKDPNRQPEIQLNSFITLYNQLSSFYLSINDAVEWLKEPNERFNNKSPLQYMADEPYGLKDVVDYWRHKMNP